MNKLVLNKLPKGCNFISIKLLSSKFDFHFKHRLELWAYVKDHKKDFDKNKIICSFNKSDRKQSVVSMTTQTSYNSGYCLIQEISIDIEQLRKKYEQIIFGVSIVRGKKNCFDEFSDLVVVVEDIRDGKYLDVMYLSDEVPFYNNIVLGKLYRHGNGKWYYMSGNPSYSFGDFHKETDVAKIYNCKYVSLKCTFNSSYLSNYLFLRLSDIIFFLCLLFAMFVILSGSQLLAVISSVMSVIVLLISCSRR